MKTAMQLLFEEFESLSKSSRDAGDSQTAGLIDFLCERKAVALEKEKEQINVSFISGAIEALSSYTPVRDRIKDGYFEDKAEQYFNYLYKENK
jgi:hypothetical protein